MSRAPAWSLPLAFVVLYGSGFVGTRLGLPHAGPFSFLAWRFALAGVVLALLAGALGQTWPRGRAAGLGILAGVLTVGVFSGGVFCAIARGMPPADVALVIALQPLAVAVGASRLLGERVSRAQIGGLLLGLAGVALVVAAPLRPDAQAGDGIALALAGLGLVGLVAGTLLQKARASHLPLFATSALQCAVCALLAALMALLCDEAPVRWTGEFIVALIWMALGVSVGAVSLLYRLIAQGSVSRVAALFYLVPVSTALTAYALFGQALSLRQGLGMLLITAAVALSGRREMPRSASTSPGHPASPHCQRP